MATKLRIHLQISRLPQVTGTILRAHLKSITQKNQERK